MKMLYNTENTAINSMQLWWTLNSAPLYYSSTTRN